MPLPVFTDVNEHVVVLEATNNNRRPDQRSVVVPDLIPHSGYRFRVRAINALGRGEEASKPSGNFIRI